MSEHDLTRKISGFLDKHLILPLLEYICVKNIYDEKSILKTKWEVLLGTSMVDYAADTYKSIYDTEPPPGLLDREKVLESIQETELKLKPVKVIFSQETMKEVAQCKNTKDLLASLETKYNFKTEMLNDMFDAARVSS
uniref:Eukaryotic translation initiation factor 3 subunit E N-terminal domain-containing protein n=1 Tax=Schistosoma japonicum TaxID=6182 RepID=Q5DEP5_SCHJA|nr:unknown [Schistosoma japonicum]